MTTIFEEAEAIVHGARQGTYGSPERSFHRIALMWTAILGVEVTTQQAMLMMVAFKLARESHAHKRDNLVDAAGYLRMMDLSTPATKLAVPALDKTTHRRKARRGRPRVK